jgi:hypothetical protein
MQWDLGTRPITDIVTSFSADDKTWQEQPQPGNDYRFVRVVATEPAPVIFLRIFQPLGLGSSKVAAASVASRTEDSARLIR